jgi:hypothetical protein
MSAELVEITPERCPNGHPLGPGRVLIGWLPCQCSWAREFGTVAGGCLYGVVKPRGARVLALERGRAGGRGAWRR